MMFPGEWSRVVLLLYLFYGVLFINILYAKTVENLKKTKFFIVPTKQHINLSEKYQFCINQNNHSV